MDKLRALQYLVKVADTLSFSRAAIAFGVPASSISRRISDLEAELGVELLHRTTRTVRLTEIGALYLEQVRTGMAQLDDAEELVAQSANRQSEPRVRLDLRLAARVGKKPAPARRAGRHSAGDNHDGSKVGARHETDRIGTGLRCADRTPDPADREVEGRIE